MRELNSAEPTRDRLQLLLDHLGAVLALSSVLLVLIRVGVVSGFDRSTGYALLSRSSPFTVLGAVAYDNLPTLLVLAALLTLLVLNRRRRLARTEPPAARAPTRHEWAAAVLFALVVALVVPIAYPIMGAVVFVISSLIGLYRRRKPGSSEGDPRAELLAMGGMMLILNLLFWTEPWMPAEVLDFRSGDRVVAYVVDSSDGVTTLLVHSPRVIRIVDSDTITRRDVCRSDVSTALNEYVPVTVSDWLGLEDFGRVPPCGSL